MSDPTRPFLVVYVVWHPAFAAGAGIAEALQGHFRRKLYENVAGGTGLSVMFRSTPMPGGNVPLSIDLGEAEATAVVLLTESNLVNDAAWLGYVQQLAATTAAAGFSARLFPVAMEQEGLNVGLREQAVRWDHWAGSDLERRQQLIRELTHEFCRVLRHWLAVPSGAPMDVPQFEAYLENVQIFISHSKHDDHGEDIAKRIRTKLQEGKGPSSFFDVVDIPFGLPFDQVLEYKVRTDAIVVVHTDSYSTREWCRKEIIGAKKWGRPLVVANCIADMDERCFPYMGNVPVVRMDPSAANRIDAIVGHLLAEVLKDYLWQCRVRVASPHADLSVTYMSRPPELISLAWLPGVGAGRNLVIVYPDPPLSAEEKGLFNSVAPAVRLHSMTEWLAGVK